MAEALRAQLRDDAMTCLVLWATTKEYNAVRSLAWFGWVHSSDAACRWLPAGCWPLAAAMRVMRTVHLMQPQHVHTKNCIHAHAINMLDSRHQPGRGIGGMLAWLIPSQHLWQLLLCAPHKHQCPVDHNADSIGHSDSRRCMHSVHPHITPR